MKFFHYTDREQFKFVSELMRKHYDCKLSMLPDSDVLCIHSFAEIPVPVGDYIVFEVSYPRIVSEKRWPLYPRAFLNPLEEIPWIPENEDAIGILVNAPLTFLSSSVEPDPLNYRELYEEQVRENTMLQTRIAQLEQNPLITRIERGVTVPIPELDPLGKSQHEKGSKLDSGKSEPSLILGSMSQSLQAVIEVADYGKKKYTENGWLEVPEAEKRYTDAMLRHYLAEQQEDVDKDSGLLHSAHLAWNALARLHFILQRTEGEVLYPPYECVSGLSHIVQHEVDKPLSPVNLQTQISEARGEEIHLKKHSESELSSELSSLVKETNAYAEALKLWKSILSDPTVLVYSTDYFDYLLVYSPAYLSRRLIEIIKNMPPAFYDRKMPQWEGKLYYTLCRDQSTAPAYYAELTENLIVGFN